MKIFAGYKPTDKPWGGANNFLRSLYQTLEKNHGVQIVFEPSPNCDVFFFGQTGKGPANDSDHYTPDDVKSIIGLNKSAPAIMRMVNLRRHTSHKYFIPYWLSAADRRMDADTKRAASLCDHLIFQSAYQQDNFSRDNVKPKNSTIIHNGAAAIFSNFNGSIEKLQPGQKIRIFSSAVSTKGRKNHGVIAAAAKNSNVELFYAGVWPKDLPSSNIKLLGRLDHEAIVETASHAHFFLHPSMKEACSNSIIEALAMGLPVLHGTEGSSPETVGQNGMPIEEHNLLRQLEKAAAMQPAFVDRLSASRARYSMDSAAEKYHATFVETIKRKAER